MLAATAPDLEAALARIAPAVVDWKLDGVRVQVHRDGGDVAVFTRTLDEVTDRVPEVVEAALALPVAAAVLDGEAIALHPDGRPRPFQVTAARFGARRDVARLRAATPLTALFFDVLHLDGDDLLDVALTERAAAPGRRRARRRPGAPRAGRRRRGGTRGARRRARARPRGRHGQGARRRPTPPAAAAATG